MSCITVRIHDLTARREILCLEIALAENLSHLLGAACLKVLFVHPTVQRLQSSKMSLASCKRLPLACMSRMSDIGLDLGAVVDTHSSVITVQSYKEQSATQTCTKSC